MTEHTDFSHIKDFFTDAKDSGCLNDEIKKEDLDNYLNNSENVGIFIRWDEMLNEAIDQYIKNKGE